MEFLEFHFSALIFKWKKYNLEFIGFLNDVHQNVQWFFWNSKI